MKNMWRKARTIFLPGVGGGGCCSTCLPVPPAACRGRLPAVFVDALLPCCRPVPAGNFWEAIRLTWPVPWGRRGGGEVAWALLLLSACIEGAARTPPRTWWYEQQWNENDEDDEEVLVVVMAYCTFVGCCCVYFYSILYIVFYLYVCSAAAYSCTYLVCGLVVLVFISVIYFYT